MKKICTCCKTEKPFCDFSKDSKGRDGLRSRCKTCDVAAVMRRREENLQSHREKQKAWREKSQDHIKKSREDYKLQNPDAHKIYYRENKERQLEKAKKWRAKNLHRWAMAEAARRVRKKRHTAAWADKSKMLAIYAECRAMRDRGHDVQVDHIVPLKGKTVSGLHCEANLRIIPSRENASKRNLHWPDMAQGGGA